MKPLSDYFRNIFYPKQNPEKMWVVYMGSFPPRACGIATFTSDLVNYFDQQFVPAEETKIIAMNIGDGAPVPAYSDKVMWQINQNHDEDYVRVAHEINALPHVKIISIQHEFGIFGSNDGERIITFLKEIQKPVAITLHTVLPGPSENILRIMREIVARADRLIVMTQTSRGLLETTYGAPAEKIKVIPHGIHPRPYAPSDTYKEKFAEPTDTQAIGFRGRKVLSTFGLLGRGKGIEFAIDAMPAIVAKYPDVLYAIIGTTHPVVLQNEGPAYINQLRDRVAALGMQDHIVFIDRYVETSELLDFLQATDIYLSLSQNPHQAVSGTLTYALGMGRPVISTPFAQAREVVTSEMGLLVEFSNSDLISQSVIALLDDPARHDWMSRTAYFRTRNMTWSNVALSYMKEFKKISNDLAAKEKSIPSIKLDHLKKMTDDFGLFQFAVLTDPDPASGYTIDDNARALVVACWFAESLCHQRCIDTADHAQCMSRVEDLCNLARVYLNFLDQAMHPDGSGFDNYFDIDKKSDSLRNTTENLEDANARAVWALAVVATSAVRAAHLVQSPAASFLIEKSRDLFKKIQAYANAADSVAEHAGESAGGVADVASAIKSPRAIAFNMKALALWLTAEPNDERAKARLIELAEILSDLYRRSQNGDWHWFEENLTYSNALLPEAMLLAYKITGNTEYKYIGVESLDFLISHSFDGDMCVPVGQKGWFKLGMEKPLFDQQPEEVSALVLALQTAAEIVGTVDGADAAIDGPALSAANGTHSRNFYLLKKEQAFDWFLGNNIIGQVVYSEMSGGCYDGLGEGYINLNQGAESTTAYLLARAMM